MDKLKRYQKKQLKKLSHRLKPVVQIGQKGVSESVTAAVDLALDTHELIKIRFVDLKEKEQKSQAISDIERTCSCEMIGRIGHIAIIYRRHDDPEKRKIVVPD